MNSEWSIRRATESDLEALVSFNRAIARETEHKELREEVVRRGVLRGMQQGDEAIYFVAESDGKAIGCLMVTREWSDWRDGWLAWIQSVYVSVDFRGQGVFRGLLENAIDELRRNPDVIGVRLYVEMENQRAQAVYARTGFADPRYKVLERIF